MYASIYHVSSIYLCIYHLSVYEYMYYVCMYLSVCLSQAFLKMQYVVETQYVLTEVQSDSNVSWSVIYGFSHYLMSINFVQSS